MCQVSKKGGQANQRATHKGRKPPGKQGTPREGECAPEEAEGAPQERKKRERGEAREGEHEPGVREGVTQKRAEGNITRKQQKRTTHCVITTQNILKSDRIVKVRECKGPLTGELRPLDGRGRALPSHDHDRLAELLCLSGPARGHIVQMGV